MERKQKPKHGKKNNNYNEIEAILSDPRFTHVQEDPRLRSAPSNQSKVKLDERFKTVLKNELFSEKACMDPRGRPKNFHSKEDYEKFYDVDDSSDDLSDDAKDNVDKANNQKTLASANKNKVVRSPLLEKKEKKVSNKKDIESAATPDDIQERLMNLDVDVTRGGCLFSDDSSDDDSSTTDDEDDDALGEFEWGELDHDAKWDCDNNIEETSQFAVCNMDFDQVKAVDLIVLFSSFAPPTGKVKKVTVYLSEFGKQRLSEEDAVGPPELSNLGSKNTEVDLELKYMDKITKGTLDETTKPTAKYTEALRRYQRNRLKYYYAVVECDNVDTAKVIYKECDRMPYEDGGVTLDLRYIPLDMNFDDEVVYDSCGSLPSNYVSEVIQTTALLDSNPTLTWDVTDRSRKATLSSAMSKAMKKQSYDYEKLKNYVANSSSEDEGEENEEEEMDAKKSSKRSRIAKFRALMDELEEKENKKTELHIDKEETFEINENIPVEIDSAKNYDITDGLTPFEKYLVKRKVKRKDKGKNNEEHEDIQFSDDELPDDAKDISSDPFFASDPKKKKKNKRGKKKDSVEQINSSEENDGELKLMMMEEEEEDVKHFSMRKFVEADIKNDKKKKKTKELQITGDGEFKIDLSDPRFAAITKSRDFNIDPSHPQYVSTKAMNVLTKQTQDSHIAQNSVFVKQIQNKRSILKDDVSHLVKKVKLKAKEANKL